MGSLSWYCNQAKYECAEDLHVGRCPNELLIEALSALESAE